MTTQQAYKTCSDLGRTMPKSGLFPISAGEHFALFNSYIGTDVWTADGWLITSVNGDGVTSQVRRGDSVDSRVIPSNEVVFINKDPDAIIAARYGVTRAEALAAVGYVVEA